MMSDTLSLFSQAAVQEKFKIPEPPHPETVTCTIKGQGVLHFGLNGRHEELPCGVPIHVSPAVYEILKNNGCLAE